MPRASACSLTRTGAGAASGAVKCRRLRLGALCVGASGAGCGVAGACGDGERGVGSGRPIWRTRLARRCASRPARSADFYECVNASNANYDTLVIVSNIAFAAVCVLNWLVFAIRASVWRAQRLKGFTQHMSVFLSLTVVSERRERGWVCVCVSRSRVC